MRVLLVDAAGTDGALYGGQRVVVTVAARTRDVIDWTVAAPTETGPYPDMLRAAGARVVRLPLRRPLVVGRTAVARLLDRERFDLVHTYDMRASAVARLPASYRSLPLVTSYQEPLTYGHLAGPAGVKRRAMIAVDRLTGRLPQILICVSGFVADDVVATLGADPARVRLVYNGVDIEGLRHSGRPAMQVRARSELGIGDEARVVALVAQLVPRKGQHLLIEAAPRILADHPRTVFVLVGDGPDRRRLEALARRLGVADQCRFTGFRHEVPALTCMADVVALPTYGDACPLSALEAMALGRPLVATQVGGLPELVVAGETGLLVPPGDADALAGGVCDLLADDERRAAMGRRAAARAEAEFSLDRVAERTLAAYRDALDECGVDGRVPLGGESPS